jgi:hypothetical protein
MCTGQQRCLPFFWPPSDPGRTQTALIESNPWGKRVAIELMRALRRFSAVAMSSASDMHCLLKLVGFVSSSLVHSFGVDFIQPEPCLGRFGNLVYCKPDLHSWRYGLGSPGQSDF